MTPLIEAVARAIMLARLDHPGCAVVDWAAEARGNPHVEQAVKQATAALTVILDAMVEPSEGMVHAGWVAENATGGDPDAIWSAMFSQLRKELTNGH